MDAETAGEGQSDEASEASVADRYPKPPYPPTLGSPFLHALRQVRDPIGFTNESTATTDVARLKIPAQGDWYVFAHPDHTKRVLVTDREKFRKSDDFRIAFGEGLATVEGDLWREQRDALQPLFTRDAVRGYADEMVEQVRRRTGRWRDGQRLALQREFTDTTLDILFATVLGRELELDGDRTIRDAAEQLHDWFVPSSYVLPDWVPTPARRRFKRAKRVIRAEADRLLTERAGTAPADPTEADDLLTLLVGLRQAGLADGEMLTDDRLRDQMVTMIFAGHDTTATALTFACWALANNPAVRDRFYDEVDQLDGPPTADDLDDLGVTERVVSETLRLFPPVYALPRTVEEDVVIDGYHIPAGAGMNVQLRKIQRDPRFFDDPDTFRPSRWDGDLRSDLHDFAYAPFGGGPRICIGREFALLEAKLALATIGREYDLRWHGENEPNGEPPVSLEMTTRMEPGHEFSVHER